MPTFQTTNARLFKPAAAERNWDVPINANADLLDGIAAIGRLLVTPVERPSASLNVRVTPGTYRNSDGSFADYAGSDSLALPPSSTTCLWLDASGQLTATPEFPTVSHLRLARVFTGVSQVDSVIDERVCLESAPSTASPPASGGGINPVSNQFGVNATTGVPTFEVVADVPAVGFFGVTPATQAPRVGLVHDASMGVPSDTVEAIGSLVIDNNFATLTARVNALIEALRRHGLMGS